MSLEQTPTGHRVRWHTPTGERSKSFPKGEKKLAQAFDDEVKRAKRMGRLPQLMAEMDTKTTVGDLSNEWWQTAELAPKTETLYAWLYNHLIAPTFEDTRLQEIGPKDVEAWLSKLETGPVAKRKAAALLSQLFNAARRWGYLQANPVELAKRPKAPAKKARKAPSPLEVERVRQALIAKGRVGDAILVSVLAYAGLRPQEALGLRWQEVRDRTLLVHASKTGRSRAVRILAPLAHDLNEWKLATGGDGLLFPNKAGRQWTDSGWSNWRRRIWHDELGIDWPPYSLRHTFVSLLIAEGMSVVEVAAQAGHSPQVCLSTYAHIFSESSGRIVSAEDEIRKARAKVAEEARKSA